MYLFCSLIEYINTKGINQEINMSLSFQIYELYFKMDLVLESV